MLLGPNLGLYYGSEAAANKPEVRYCSCCAYRTSGNASVMLSEVEREEMGSGYVGKDGHLKHRA